MCWALAAAEESARDARVTGSTEHFRSFLQEQHLQYDAQQDPAELFVKMCERMADILGDDELLRSLRVGKKETTSQCCLCGFTDGHVKETSGYLINLHTGASSDSCELQRLLLEASTPEQRNDDVCQVCKEHILRKHSAEFVPAGPLVLVAVER